MADDDPIDEQPEPIKWPDVPRLCFGPGPDGRLDACVGWIQSRTQDLDGYAEGYRRAAVAVFESAVATRASPDRVLFPLAFLWRHHVELALKEIIAIGKVLEGKEWSFPEGHGLLDLWRKAKPHVQRCGARKSPELKNVEANIHEFERIDPFADGFRYPLNREGSARSMPNAPEYVNLRQLQDAMEALANFFSGVRMELSSRVEAEQDMASQYRGYGE